MTTITAASGAATTTNTYTAKETISSDFQTFLTLMTTQLQNQDPTSPIDSSDYAAQLAQFSQVEQQVKTNDLLEALSAQLGGSGMSQYADWVGMRALAQTPALFDGTAPVTMAFDVASGADQAVLVVKNAAGTEVTRLPVPVDASEVAWNGTDASGNLLGAGVYSFSFESYSNGELLSANAAQVYSGITEVRLGTGGVTLLLDNGQEIAPGDVVALRAANA
ncbi:flagellar basal body rod modification protein [Sinirhodobacter populi]|uniref:Basal-body rod modification protein FlgD n=1 Tax=Paenirhodobacter populi TaxID=2306993 RepID=A0A443KM11_9RHOB|nr:flagellar hook capping FlgD N-terminal domain-containing protein [Sinirhodobacter populi]RWR33836.1 flagellar basal body rod modification protein [Sinirhodobacter populi]